MITGAATTIIVVFAGFTSGQLVTFQEMGFGIAVAPALDATLVRLLLIPAAMRVLGERNCLIVNGFRASPILDDARFTGGDGGSLRPAAAP